MRLLQQLFRVKYVSEMDFSCMRYYPRCHKPDGLWCRGVVTSNGWGYHAECRKQPPFTFEKSHCWNRGGSHHQQVGGWEGLQFPRTAVVFGEGEEGLLIHLFSSSLTQVGNDLLQRREAPIFWQIILYFDFQQ